MSVVLDTNVLLSSTLWQGSVAQKLLIKLIRSNTDIFSSAEIISEYKNVLKRDFEYTNDDIGNIVKKVFSFAKIVKPTERINAVNDDPDDNKIIECAIASSSQCIITYDKHLLRIGEFQGVRILTPEEKLKAV